MIGGALFSLIAFVVALGLLVTIHEFGHFWVARKCNVKVLRFSIGFGKPFWSRRGKVDDTEYAVAAIPLGGYVKMLDEREGDVDPAERHRAFNTQSVWKRIAIVAAGPIANFLLAIAAYWLMLVIGISGVVPMVATPPAGTPAAVAGFEAEERIVAIAGEETQTWNNARLVLMEAALESDDGRIDVRVEDRYGVSQTRTLDLSGMALLKEEGDAVERIGLTPWFPLIEPVIGGVQPDGAAAEAGLREGDRVISANAEPIESWQDWVLFVRAHPAQLVELEIERAGSRQQVMITPRLRESEQGEIGYIGAWEAQSAELFARLRTQVSYGPLEAISRAVQQTWDMASLTVRVLGRLVIGEASLSNISGPLTIAQYAGQTASIGIDHYLNFIALISISLGVLNLLPVPVLDGGHLLYFFVEVVKGSPVSERVQIWGQQLGMTLLVALMGLAFYNDLLRLLN